MIDGPSDFAKNEVDCLQYIYRNRVNRSHTCIDVLIACKNNLLHFEKDEVK